MATRLADRLHAMRQQRFVGREAELKLWRSLLESDTLPFCVLYVYGPGGVGKTSLLRAFVDICREVGVEALYLDARNIDASPQGLLAALQAAHGSNGDTTAMFPADQREVILIDTYETLLPLDDWLRERWLPQLPEDVLVVLVGRHRPSVAWRSDPGWQTCMHTLPLRNLSVAESQEYLARRALPSDQLSQLVHWTHGHPLALSLVADVWSQRPGVAFQPEQVPDIIKTLLEQFVQKVPSPAHRSALEACALVRVMTEPLLNEMLGMPDAHEVFEWLRALSFIDAGPGGLFPHDLAREALAADLRWRNPRWYAELHRRARGYYANCLKQTRGYEQQLVLFDYVFLHRDNPVMRPFLEWQETGTAVPDTMHEADMPDLVGIVAAYEGEEAAQTAVYWLRRQAKGVTVYRDDQGRAAGFIVPIALAHTTPDDRDRDPVIATAWRYLETRAPLRLGEGATFFRFWMARDSYQAVSPTQTLLFGNAAQHYLTTPGLAFSFFPCADAAFWEPLFTHIDLQRLHEVEYEAGGRHFGVFGHDWRRTPPLAWLDLLAERELAEAPAPAPPAPATSLVVLSQDAFEAAVRDALRNWLRPDALHENPLLLARLVVERTGTRATEAERMAALKGVVRQAIELLQAAPREEKWYRAVFHTYLQPAPTQEIAAERLDLPFSSYRRHLKAGVERVTELLWHWELHGPGDQPPSRN